MPSLLDRAQRPFVLMTERLPDNLRGVLWMVVGSIAFGVMGAGIKFAGNSGMHAFEVAFFRCLFGLIALAPFLFGGGVRAVLATKRPVMHSLRALFGSLTMLCIFYAITHMELAAATALAYARPLFLIVLAVFFLGEAVRWRRWLATVCGFAGVVMILRPDVGAFNDAAWAALAAAFLMACVIIIIKRMSETERPLTMLAWFSITSCIVTGAAALPVWATPTLEQLAMLAAVGVVGTIGQYCVLRAYRLAEATIVVPFDYFQIPIAWALGFFLFAEKPSWLTLAGAVVIAGSTLYILLREARIKGRTPPPASATDTPA
jgi:drug/metabolite transporter (DMT)-like permease